MVSWFFRGVKFHERLTSAKFVEFMYLEKTNHMVYLILFKERQSIIYNIIILSMYITQTITYLVFVKQTKFILCHYNGHKHFNTNARSSHNQNKYYRIHYRNVGKCYKNIKIPPLITVSACYYISLLSSGLQVWTKKIFQSARSVKYQSQL